MSERTKPLSSGLDGDFEDTASSMAWTLNDEPWGTAPETRRVFWRRIARDMVAALMLPAKQKDVELEKIYGRIKKEGLTP